MSQKRTNPREGIETGVRALAVGTDAVRQKRTNPREGIETENCRQSGMDAMTQSEENESS